MADKYDTTAFKRGVGMAELKELDMMKEMPNVNDYTTPHLYMAKGEHIMR